MKIINPFAKPKTPPKCHKCGKPVLGNKKLFIDGRLVCAKCKIMSVSRFAKQIRYDGKKLREDLLGKEDTEQKKADNRAIDVAISTRGEMMLK